MLKELDQLKSEIEIESEVKFSPEETDYLEQIKTAADLGTYDKSNAALAALAYDAAIVLGLSDNEAKAIAGDEEQPAEVDKAPMSTLTTDTLYNFNKAENKYFSWSYWDGTSGKTLTEKSSGRQIYQMKYTDTGEGVQGETRVKASAFWSALGKLQDDPKPELTIAEATATEKLIEQLPDPDRNNHPGWCNLCHSYCYGDCTAND